MTRASCGCGSSPRRAPASVRGATRAGTSSTTPSASSVPGSAPSWREPSRARAPHRVAGRPRLVLAPRHGSIQASGLGERGEGLVAGGGDEHRFARRARRRRLPRSRAPPRARARRDRQLLVADADAVDGRHRPPRSRSSPTLAPGRHQSSTASIAVRHAPPPPLRGRTGRRRTPRYVRAILPIRRAARPPRSWTRSPVSIARSEVSVRGVPSATTNVPSNAGVVTPRDDMCSSNTPTSSRSRTPGASASTVARRHSSASAIAARIAATSAVGLHPAHRAKQ